MRSEETSRTFNSLFASLRPESIAPPTVPKHCALVASPAKQTFTSPLDSSTSGALSFCVTSDGAPARGYEYEPLINLFADHEVEWHAMGLHCGICAQKLLKPSSSSGSSSSDDRPLTAFAHSPVSHATIVTRSS